jgi:hypothetical protein
MNPSDDVSRIVEQYNNDMRSILDKHAPMKRKVIIVREKSPWYNCEIKVAKQLCRKHERVARKSKLQVHRQVYASQVRLVSDMILSAKRSYYSTLVSEHASNQGKLFSIFSDLLHKDKSKSNLPQHTDPTELANKFANFFSEKIGLIRDCILNHQNYSPLISCRTALNLKCTMTEFKPACSEEVSTIIRKSSRASCSLDPIPTNIVKGCVDELLPTILKIINLSLTSGNVPDLFKTANVIPLLKKTSLDQNVLGNYRPVSNLPFLSKVLERVVAKQLNDHLVRNNLLEPFQSAYRELHSTETALLRVQNDVLCSMDERKCVLLVLLDLSAAFDTIDHDVMLSRLAELGILDTSLAWFSSYLRKRHQMIIVNNIKSEEHELTSGVPQGSVLGPILFTIYTAPLGVLLQSHGISYHFYADDTQLYLAFYANDQANAREHVEDCVRDIKLWMLSNLLQLNDKKTEILLITSPHLRHKVDITSLHIGEADVSFSASARNIGVTFDNSLSMEAHVTTVCRSIFMNIRNIRQICSFLDENAVKTLVHATITSRLDYCNSLLIGIPSSQLDRLQRAQNTAARLITHTKRFDHITPVLLELHWLPIRQRIWYKVALLVFKCLHDLAPPYLKSLIQQRAAPRSLRSSTQLLSAILELSST